MMHIKALGGWDKTGSRINSEKSKHFETLGTKNYSMVTNTSFRPDTKSMSKCLNMKHKLTKKMKNTKIELLDANCKKVLVDALENTKNAILNVTRHLHKRRHMRHKTTFVRKEPKKLLELKAEVREEKLTSKNIMRLKKMARSCAKLFNLRFHSVKNLICSLRNLRINPSASIMKRVMRQI
eukprot:TRINITY_DN7431_c0_g1_i3.p1 TRINITY_DN7431_c0_g1~~TRINITY_DN7431_c0_g1_i3.p1  ORF type:complete len:181 (+),score=13.18 TRINITY_DN7431_c0_g1_i3:317-859(+)